MSVIHQITMIIQRKRAGESENRPKRLLESQAVRAHFEILNAEYLTQFVQNNKIKSAKRNVYLAARTRIIGAILLLHVQKVFVSTLYVAYNQMCIGFGSNAPKKKIYIGGLQTVGALKLY